MKKSRFGILATALVFVIITDGCDSGPKDDDDKTRTVTYESIDKNSGTKYIFVITKNGSTVATGDAIR